MGFAPLNPSYGTYKSGKPLFHRTVTDFVLLDFMCGGDPKLPVAELVRKFPYEKA